MQVTTDHQKEIGVVQHALIRKFFPQFSLGRVSDDDAYYQGDVESVALSGQFTLRLQYVPKHPEICPFLYVWDPIVLPMNAAKHPADTINARRRSHAFHTNENGPDGRVSICHLDIGSWDPSMTYVQVLLKGAMWLNAYEGHLRTGSPIADYFRP